MFLLGLEISWVYPVYVSENWPWHGWVCVYAQVYFRPLLLPWDRLFQFEIYFFNFSLTISNVFSLFCSSIPTTIRFKAHLWHSWSETINLLIFSLMGLISKLFYVLFRVDLLCSCSFRFLILLFKVSFSLTIVCLLCYISWILSFISWSSIWSVVILFSNDLWLLTSIVVTSSLKWFSLSSLGLSKDLMYS